MRPAGLVVELIDKSLHKTYRNGYNENADPSGKNPMKLQNNCWNQ